jgi:rhamnosyltransferase
LYTAPLGIDIWRGRHQATYVHTGATLMVSVVIPTLNAGACLEALLTRLEEQTVSCDILVVDSSSSDASRAIAESHGVKTITIEREDFNHGGTRNLAVREASGDVVVFLTQDVLPEDKKCIESLIRPLEDPKIAACYGRQLPRDDASPTERFARGFNYPETPRLKSMDSVSELGIKTFFFSNACSAVRRKEFEEVGGFPEDVVMFEDMLLAARLLEKGYNIMYTPEARVIHSHNLSLGQQFRRYLDAGATFKRHPWFLALSGSGREGWAFLLEELRYLARVRKYHWIPYALAEAGFKFCGYTMGLRLGRKATG